MKYFMLILMVLIGIQLWNGHKKDTDKDSEFKAYSEKIPGSNISIDMTPVPGGTFMMGSPVDESGRKEDEGPQREVMVDSFWMGVFEISWDQYDPYLKDQIGETEKMEVTLDDGTTVMVDGISSATPMYIDMSFGMGREGFPAINMTQYAAMMYAKWLFAKTGNFYRLPTEAEWEYACRAGSGTAYSFGNNPGDLEKFAWYKDNSGQGYKKVGTKSPNALGLYDMHGNVAEWTADQYIEDYHEQLKETPAVNPYYQPTTLYPRAVRGGSWMDDRDDLRSASRQASSKQWKQRDPQMPKSIWWLTDAEFIGFRLVRPKERPSREEMELYWIKVMEDY